MNRLSLRQGVAARRAQQVSKTYSVPAPIGGLNAHDPIAAMPPTDAVILDNWFPETTSITLRNGSTNHSTGLPAWVETLMDYRSGTAHKIFGISGTSVYDVTSTGAVGAAVKTGLTNARFEWTNIETPAGQYLYFGNALDKPVIYDGTTFTSVDGASTPAITGVTTTKLRNPIVWKNRLWWIEDASTKAWYLPVQSIGGAANSIDVGTYFRLGGTLHALITATLANGNNYDDYLAFLSTEGELLLYQGTDPATAGLFQLQGRYRVGTPIGRRCWFRYGSDIIIITADGFQSLSKLIQKGDVGAETTISEKILDLISFDALQYQTHFGWEGIVFPFGGKLIINVPLAESSEQYQYVLNTLTNTWCRFTNWNAATFLMVRNQLFFGGNTVVTECDIGQDDNGAAISGTVLPAFSYMEFIGQKHFHMVRPIMLTTAPLSGILAINVDFAIKQPLGTPSFSSTVGAVWDVAPWDTSDWTSGYTVQKNWQAAPGIGFSASTYFNIQSKTSQVKLASMDYLYSEGGVL